MTRRPRSRAKYTALVATRVARVTRFAPALSPDAHTAAACALRSIAEIVRRGWRNSRREHAHRFEHADHHAIAALSVERPRLPQHAFAFRDEHQALLQPLPRAMQPHLDGLFRHVHGFGDLR